MKHGYAENTSRAMITLDQRRFEDRVWEITRVNVPEGFRKEGIAGELLKRVCQDADREGVTLVMMVSPSGGLSFDDLIQFYERRGFYLYDKDLPLMRREPVDE